jgi:hypothetical protein
MPLENKRGNKTRTGSILSCNYDWPHHHATAEPDLFAANDSCRFACRVVALRRRRVVNSSSVPPSETEKLIVELGTPKPFPSQA